MDPDAIFHDSFYKFVDVADIDATAATLRDLTSALTGSLLVASEGINGTLAGSAAALDAFRAALASDPRLEGTLHRHRVQAQPLRHAAVPADEGARTAGNPAAGRRGR
ncbi:MAG: hypothetical protein V9G29_17515 [Burkholderiaceae bacterium]